MLNALLTLERCADMHDTTKNLDAATNEGKGQKASASQR